jgi:hypothetical protein
MKKRAKPKRRLVKPQYKTELSGLLGEIITVRKVNGHIVITNRPKRVAPKPTGKQPAIRSNFYDAAKYANRQTANPETNALYATRITRKKRSSYLVALADYLNKPKVRSIDTSDYDGSIGCNLIVDATDDFMVTRVEIRITGPGGKVIEKGEAQTENDGHHLWTYKTTIANPNLKGTIIRAKAFDMPKHWGMMEVTL